MNDLNTVMQSSMALVAITSHTDRRSKSEPIASGNNLPHTEEASSMKAANKLETAVLEKVEASSSKNDNAKTEELQEAVQEVKNFVQNVQRNLQFSIDEGSERMIVKVIEASSGEIIRQIPDESFLELARKMREHGEVHLVNARG